MLQLKRSDALAASGEAQAEDGSARPTVVLLLVISAGLSAAIGMLMLHRVVQPIAAITHLLKRLSERDSVATVSDQNRQDEIGEMARAAQIFRDGMMQADALAAEQAASGAEREQRGRDREEAVSRFNASLSDLISRLNHASGDLKDVSRG